MIVIQVLNKKKDSLGIGKKATNRLETFFSLLEVKNCLSALYSY